jgi:hypothetical protein
MRLMIDSKRIRVVRCVAALGALAIAVSACPTDVRMVDPNDVALNRTYAAYRCSALGYGETALPCETEYAASHISWVDSGSVSLRPDHTAIWMLSGHTDNSCTYWEQTGGTGPCPYTNPGPESVVRATGPYVFTRTTLRILLPADTIVLDVSVDAQVRSDWTGPEALSIQDQGALLRFQPF